MKSIVFHPVEDEEFGGVGLLPDGYASAEGVLNAITAPFALAHDVIEHVNGFGRIGGVSDELEAFGALWWCRGRHSDIQRNNYAGYLGPHESVALEVAELFRKCDQGSGEHSPVFNRAGDYEDDFSWIITKAHQYAKQEDRESFNQARFNDFAVSARTRMRAGLRKARRRYGDEANRLFWEIAEVMTPHMKGLEEGGPLVRLTYGIKDGRGFARASEFERF